VTLCSRCEDLCPPRIPWLRGDGADAWACCATGIGSRNHNAFLRSPRENGIQVVLPVGVDTAAVDCAITASEIQVTVAGTKLMEGSLAATVVPEDCTWTIHRPQVANPINARLSQGSRQEGVAF
jgi:hypothetical protein